MAYDDDNDSTGAIPDSDHDADDQGKQAGMMPTIPGNQSETPGPYTPQQPQPQRQAGAMPMIPGNQSETPGPYTPQQPQPQRQAGAMPMIPGNQSETPGPYTPQQPQPRQAANDSNALIAQALAAVQHTVQYTRKKYGLDQGTSQQASAMPTVPGSQSESGVPPVQPMPGRLPPTANPFGKRADAEPAGAIPDEDDQEAA